VKNFFTKIEENIIAIFLPSTCILIVLATFGRYTGFYSLYWSEELVRYIYIWLAFLGISLGVKSDAHFRVSLLVNVLPQTLRKIVQVLAVIVVITFLGLMVYHGAILIQKQIYMEQISPMIGIPMFIPYAAICVGCLTMAIRVVLKLINDLRKKDAAIVKGET
jgi:C4-dicarboxylate transporter DctQ subunit